MILYEHYRKDVATKATVHARSALPMKQKKTILTQELLTVMRNCSPKLETARKTQHINNFMMRLQFSGYSQEFRFDILNSAKKGYEIQVQRSESQGVPLNRPRQWERRRRKREKDEKKKTWFKKGGEESVIFVPCTPEGKLMRAYQEQIKKSGFKIKVVEQSGTKLKDLLHGRDPFKKQNCGHEDCLVCGTGGKGNCRKENITYVISCTEECNEKDLYKGETSYNAYTRGDEHLKKYESNNPKSMLVQHCNIVHDGRRVKFRMDVTGSFHHDTTKRQITEGLQIEETPKNRLMNSKSEWNTPQMPQCVVRRLSER